MVITDSFRFLPTLLLAPALVGVVEGKEVSRRFAPGYFMERPVVTG